MMIRQADSLGIDDGIVALLRSIALTKKKNVVRMSRVYSCKAANNQESF